MKIRRPITAWCAVAALTLTCGLASANAVRLLRYVPPEADFAAGVNVRRMAENPAVAQIVPAETQREIESMAHQIEAYAGVNLLHDIEGAVIAGLLRGDMPGAIFFQGQWDRERLIQIISQNPSYATSLYRNATIHAWQDADGAKQHYAAFLADGVLVMAEGEVRIVQAVVAHHAGGGAGFAPTSLPSPDPLAFVIASKPPAGAAALSAAPVLSKLVRVAAGIDAEAGGASVRLRAAAVDEHNAKLLKETFEGAVALLQLSDPHPQYEWKSHVVQEGSAVHVDVSLPPAKVAALLQTLRQGQEAE